MNSVESRLKELILSRYKSVHAFTQIIGIPHSTFDSILKRGILNANVGNILKITRELNIDVEALADGQLIDHARNKIKTVVANLDGDDFTETEFNDIAKYLEFVKDRRDK